MKKGFLQKKDQKNHIKACLIFAQKRSWKKCFGQDFPHFIAKKLNLQPNKNFENH